MEATFKVILFAFFLSTAFASYHYSHNHDYHHHPYHFGYHIKDHHGSQYRQEKGDGHSTVKGSYGFTDHKGIHRVVNYIADHHGFRAEVKTNEPGTGNQDPAHVKVHSNPSYQHHYENHHRHSYHGRDYGHVYRYHHQEHAKHHHHHKHSHNPGQVHIYHFQKYPQHHRHHYL